MTFDPFGDFATEGYLRNFFKEKDPDIIKDRPGKRNRARSWVLLWQGENRVGVATRTVWRELLIDGR